MRVTTKVIGSKAYSDLASARRVAEATGDQARAMELQAVLNLTYCNLDETDWHSWDRMGLTESQKEKLQNKIDSLPDGKRLVVTVTD